jgi:peroxiredoxin
MLIDDSVVRKLSVEETPGKAEVSGADALLKAL